MILAFYKKLTETKIVLAARTERNYRFKIELNINPYCWVGDFKTS